MRVLITRPKHQYSALAEKFQAFGAVTTSHPVTEIGPAPDPEKVKQCIEGISRFEAVVFLSRNAATCFAKAESIHRRSNQRTSMPRLGAMGSGTKTELEQHGYQVQFLPEHSNSLSMAERIIDRFGSRQNRPLLIVRADRGSDVLARRLREARVPFEELAIYSTRDIEVADPLVLKSLAEGQFDWITLTSSTIATNVGRLFRDQLGNMNAVSISPQTTEAAQSAGITVTAEAENYDMDGLVDAVIRFESANAS